jgi:hypothetical protein
MIYCFFGLLLATHTERTSVKSVVFLMLKSFFGSRMYFTGKKGVNYSVTSVVYISVTGHSVTDTPH